MYRERGKRKGGRERGGRRGRGRARVCIDTGICSIVIPMFFIFFFTFLLAAEKFTAIQQRIKANLVLVSRSRFKVLVPYNTCVIEIFKKMPSKCYGELIYI